MLPGGAMSLFESAVNRRAEGGGEPGRALSRAGTFAVLLQRDRGRLCHTSSATVLSACPGLRCNSRPDRLLLVSPRTETDVQVPFPEEVADGVRAGDPDAVGAVYVALADRLLGYLMARVRDRGVAEDLLEATFVELLQKGKTIRGGAASIKVWLFRAAYFNALDHLRKVKRRMEDLTDDEDTLDVLDAGTASPEDLAVQSDLRRRVRKAMSHLSAEQRQVLLLRYVAGLTAPEVAAVLDKSDGAIRSLQHRAERALAKLLESERETSAPVSGSGTS